MRASHQFLPRRVLPTTCAAALCAIFGATGAATAQLQTLAHYPLLNDIIDVTGTYGPIALTGTPPPAMPANGVCVNGIYSLSAGGQDVRTPVISALDANDFQIEVEFNLAALPAGNRPVLMAGNGWRWIGFYVQPNGTFGMKYNNSNLVWSSTVVSPGTWYAGMIKFENDIVELYLDGAMVYTAVLGPLNTGNNLNFTTNDFSNAGSFFGCIRNLKISNDTTLGPSANVANYGEGCDGMTMNGDGLPALGNVNFALDIANVPPVLPLAYVAFGSSTVNPGFDLTPLGMTGCFSYTPFDLGLFGPAIATGSDASFLLPIPNDPGLLGVGLSAQAIAFTAANPFGLASSNGCRLTLGL